MRALKLQRTEKREDLENQPRKRRRAKKALKKSTIGFWQGVFVFIKFLDNAICHMICGIGLWEILKQLGIVIATYNWMVHGIGGDK